MQEKDKEKNYSFSAVNADGKTIYYKITSSDTVEVVSDNKGNKYRENIVIPDTVNNNGIIYTVISIGERAFSYCSGLTSVNIPNTVTSIGKEAFNCCCGLTFVSIPNTVTFIGNEVFYGCKRLTSISIPNSVTSIGEGAFAGCTALISISVDENNTAYSFNDGVLFDKHQTRLLCCPQGKTGNYTIPNSVTSIGDCAFENCGGLTSVTIGNSVTYIGEWAFADCNGLTSVTIGNSVTSIGDCAFENCGGLTSVTIGNSVTSIGKYAFCCCRSLMSVTIPDSVTSIRRLAFRYCSSLTSITVDVNNTEYSSKDGVLFNKNQTRLIYCPAGKTGNYTIPNSVTAIEEYAFDSYSGLISISVDESNTEYSSKDGVLFNKNQTRLLCYPVAKKGSYTIPHSVTSIERDAFGGCRDLTSVTIGSSITAIGDWAFCKCSGLTSVSIPDSVTSIENWVFYECSGLTSVSIGNTVTSIEEGAFGWCSGLISISVDESNTEYSSNDGVLFDKDQTILIYCPRGKTGSYTIPNTVTYIEEYAFEGCDGLTKIYVKAKNPPSIEENTFEGVSDSIPVYVPAGSGDDYRKDIYWSRFTNIIEDESMNN